MSGVTVLTLVRSAGKVWTFDVNQDITGAALRFIVKRSYSDLDVDAVADKAAGSGIEVIDAAAGTGTFSIDAADTDALPNSSMSLKFELRVDDYVVDHGVINLTPGLVGV